MKCNKCNQEIKESKFKVGDYVVEDKEYNNCWKTEFIKIFSLFRDNEGNYKYNLMYWPKGHLSYLHQDELREPNQDELDKYFR